MNAFPLHKGLLAERNELLIVNLEKMIEEYEQKAATKRFAWTRRRYRKMVAEMRVNLTYLKAHR